MMVYLELAAVVALMLANGVLAMSELALVSSRKSRLECLAKDGDRGARAALQLYDDPSRFLSTVQIGITLVGVLAGALGGATLGARLGDWLGAFPALADYGDPLGVGVAIVTITYLSLVVGELVPKRVALADPEGVASLVARPMLGLSLAAAPAVWILKLSTEALLRCVGLHKAREATITEDEVKSLIAEGAQTGVFVPQEKAMIEGVLRLADRPLRVIMTPRPMVVWIDVDADREAIAALTEAHPHSQLLVCKGSIDNPVGFAHSKQLLPHALRNEDLRLQDALAPLVFAPEHTNVLSLLNRFKKEHVHAAIVVDEYGATEGLVTLTDVIEAIAGDFPLQGETQTPQLTQRHDSSWLADGTTPTDEVAAATGIDMGEQVDMLAAFVLQHLGRIPSAGASFFHEHARFEVVDMDGRRIDKVLITLNDDNPHEPGEAPSPPPAQAE